MDFEITPEQQELIDSVRSVLAHECPTALARDVVENGSAPEQPWKCARELGWTSIDLPETLGGFELGFLNGRERLKGYDIHSVIQY